MKNILIIFSSILFAFSFILSAILKMYPLEPFELYIYSFGIFNWELNAIAVRLFIAFELCVGIFILSSVRQKKAIAVGLGSIIVFSFFLIYLMVFKNEDNCFCYGEALPFTPLQSLLKNVFLIALGFLLVKFYDINWRYPFKKQLSVVLVVASLLTPFVISVPDSWIYAEDKNNQKNGQEFPKEKFADYIEINNSGKQIICFLGMGCKFCQLTANKLTVVDRRYGNKLPVTYIFFGSEQNLDNFWTKSKSEKYPYTIVPTSLFFEVSQNTIPTIYFVEDGIIKNTFGYRELSETDIVDFYF